MNDTPYITTPDNAAQIADWLRHRQGIAIWMSADLSRPGESMTTPYLNGSGNPSFKPDWWLDNQPARIITDFADVLVSNDVEVKRFHIALRRGFNGLHVKVSDTSTRRIRAEVRKAGEGAYYVFDYATQEAVIMKPASQIPLLEWLQQAPVTQ